MYVSDMICFKLRYFSHSFISVICYVPTIQSNIGKVLTSEILGAYFWEAHFRDSGKGIIVGILRFIIVSIIILTYITILYYIRYCTFSPKDFQQPFPCIPLDAPVNVPRCRFFV